MLACYFIDKKTNLAGGVMLSLVCLSFRWHCTGLEMERGK
jgi:hypothetical protein